MERTFAMLGSLLMLLGVAAGAFGAHALRDYFDQYPDLNVAGWWDTAVQYHMIHALGLFAVAWARTQTNSSLATSAGWLLTAGLLIFCGSLYTMVFTRQTWLGAITPIGGVAFIAGWVCLFLSLWQSR